MNKQKKIQREIEQIKEEIVELGLICPGSLSKQKRKWGKSYWHWSYYHRGKGHTNYISEEKAELMRQSMNNYRKFQELIKKLLDKSIELCQSNE